MFPMPVFIGTGVSDNPPQLVRKAEELLSPASLIRLSTLVGTNDSMSVRGDSTRVLMLGDWTNAGPSSVDAAGPMAAAAVQDLRRRTNLPLATLARMLGVERRSVYFWIEGRPIAPENQARLDDLRSLAVRLDQGNPADTAKLLLASADLSRDVPARTDRLAGLRATEGEPGSRLPAYGVATLLERGDDRLPTQTPPSSPSRR
jgi:hypothetical protein